MIGAERDLFAETPEHCRQLSVSEPFITNAELEKIRAVDVNGIRSETLSTLFDPEEKGGLRKGDGQAAARGVGRGGARRIHPDSVRQGR